MFLLVVFRGEDDKKSALSKLGERKQKARNQAPVFTARETTGAVIHCSLVSINAHRTRN